MRVSKAEMDKSHQRIVEGASRLMRKQGIETTSVNEVMANAGLTHGGFYRHFNSKEALVSAALETAFDEAIENIEKKYAKNDPKIALQKYREFYLSKSHVDHPEIGCPIAALGGDIKRSSKTLKDAFGKGFKRIIHVLAKRSNGNEEKQRIQAMREFAMMAGAIMIARAADQKTAEAVISACLQP